jgi:hypothetical protein
VVGVAGILLGPAVLLLLPRYEPAVAPARVFVFTGLATGLASLATVAALAAERHRRFPLWAALGVASNLGLSSLALRAGLGLPGVALGALFSQSLYTAAVVTMTARAGGLPSPGRVAIAALGPTLWCAGVLVALQRFVPMMAPGSALLGLACFLLLLAPLHRRLRRTLRRRHR